MRRILAILILIFITSLYTINIIYTINNERPTITKVEKVDKFLKNTKPKREVKFKFKKSEIFFKKPITILETPKIDRSLPDSSIHHNATWYKTDGTRVHREYPTAAYNHVPKGTKLLVTNTKNQKTCIVEVTDRNGMGKYHIDLSHMAFGSLADHSIGTIKVLVKILEK
jgi:rare lipoprotein A (peptidoglycan hydrolase)